MDPLDPIDERLQQLLERPEESWEPALAELCAQETAAAEEIRRRFGLLRSSGFLGSGAPGEAQPDFPDRLGEFELLQRLGQGGMGVVFAARQERLGRTVALKLVRPEQLYFAGARERFQREVSAVAKLSHPGIVSVFNVGEEQGLPYFAMELLRGASLDEVLRALAGRQVESLTGADLWRVVARDASLPSPAFLDEPFTGPWTEVCAGIARRVAEALAHAHQNGVVHRDIKPSNVIVTPEGRVVLLDFGLARPIGVDRVTRAGSHVGSLPYMAPEQLRGDAGDARTDVYGLGVLLRELLTLRQPFLSPASETTRRRILHGEGAALELGNHAVSWELATVCAMATEPDPRRRYAAAADFARDLENVRQHRPIRARPAGALRRFWRWTERHPALATGLCVGLLAAIGTPTAIAIGIAEQRDRARTAEAEQQRKAYQANLAAANAALQSHDAAEVRRRLDDCPAALRGFEWNQLALALDSSLLTLRGHARALRTVALTADGAWLASGDEQGELRLWDVARGECLRTFVQHRAALRQTAFSADGRLLLSVDEAGRTSVIDVAARTLLAERPRAASQERVWIGTDGGSVLASLGGWHMLELDPRTLETRREIVLEPVGQPPQDLLATDGRRVCAMSGPDLHVWDLESGREIQRLPNLISSSVQALALSRGGDRLAVSDGYARIVIVGVEDGRVLQRLSDSGRFGAVAFDPAGEQLAEVGPDGVLRVFDIASGRMISLQLGHVGPIHELAFAGGRMLISTAGEDGTLRLWSPFGGRDQQALCGHVGIVSRLALSGDGERLVSVSRDGSLRTWDVATGMPLSTLPDYPHHVNALALAADGSTAWSAFHNTLISTELASMRSAPPWPLDAAWVLDLALARDGSRLLAATSSGCKLLDPRARRVLRELGSPGARIRACAFDSGAQVAFAGGEDGRLERWDLRREDAGRTLIAGGPRIEGLAVAHDDRSIFVAAGQTLQRRSAGDGALVWEQQSSSALRSLVELGDGSRVVTGHADGTVVFWDARSGAPMLTRRLSEFAISALACDPRDGFVAAGDANGFCHLLRATAPGVPGDVLRAAGTRAAPQLHASMRSGPHTHADVLAAIEARGDLDPQMREWLLTCERCSLRMPWASAYAAYELVLEPGLPPARYRAVRRVAEAYLEVAGPRDTLAQATIALASARLGENARALAACAVFGEEELGRTLAMESALRTGRALALCADGQREPALAELERLAALAGAADATSTAVSLWREAEAALSAR